MLIKDPGSLAASGGCNFDVCVVDTDAPSYRCQAVLQGAEDEKKQKYSNACVARRASFTPLCVSVDGLLGNEAAFFIRRLANSLSAKWEKPFSVVMGWVRAHLAFAILHATMVCVRGFCQKWRSSAIMDGALLFETIFHN